MRVPRRLRASPGRALERRGIRTWLLSMFGDRCHLEVLSDNARWASHGTPKGESALGLRGRAVRGGVGGRTDWADCSCWGSAAVVSFLTSQFGRALGAGASFLVAIFIATVTVGFAIAQCASCLLDRPMVPSALRDRPSRRSIPLATGVRCGCCGRSMRQIGSVRVCAVCDCVPADG